MRERPREFTGTHMLVVMLTFFAVIIGVNMTMAMLASSSWTGLVVKNSYVASQYFNERSAEGRAQVALGWKGELSIADGRISYRLIDASGGIVPLDGVTVVLHRPIGSIDERQIELSAMDDGSFALETEALADGVWIVKISAGAGLAQPYRDTRRITLTGGVLR